MKKLYILVLLIGLFLTQSVELHAQVTKLKDIVASGTNGRVANDGFGGAIAISDDIIVVGASRQDYNSSGMDSLRDAGAAYVFYKDEGGKNNWGLVKKLVGGGINGRLAYDFFGLSVAISEDIIVVGAVEHDYDANGSNKLFAAGAAYVFYKDEGGKNNWGFVKKLVGSGLNGRQTDDYFGNSVAVSDDVIVVGARDQDYDANGANFLGDGGAAYVFHKDKGGVNNWGFVKKLVGSGLNGRGEADSFGHSVAISVDVIIIGAIRHRYDADGGNSVSSAGAAYVFHKDEGGANNWGFVKKLVGSGSNGRGEGDDFGSSVSISQNIVVIGARGQDYDTSGMNNLNKAGAAYIFYKNKGGINNWGVVKKITGMGTNGRVESDNFGYSVAVSGNIIIIGASGQDFDDKGSNFIDRAGAAYIYYKNEGGIDNWGGIKKIVGSDINGRATVDGFGYSVAISKNIITVGIVGQSFDQNGSDSLLGAGKASIFYVTPSTTSNKELINSKIVHVSSYKKTVLLNFLHDGDYQIQVTDLLGRNLKTRKIKANVGVIEKLNLESVATGYYVVNIMSETHNKSAKVFIH